jgi:hypothetical protein
MMVFSAEWFESHQAALLRFANTRYGRYVLRIHGKRSAVGNRRITRIEPYAISWQNDDGTYSTEYRSHAKFAKRLYYAYKPLWALFHAWDMAVANRLTEALNLGFDTLTSYPQANYGPGNNTTDGYVFRDGGAGESFSTIRGGTGNGQNAIDSRLLIALFGGDTTNNYQYLVRSIMTFDTSSIYPATVTAATLSLYVNRKGNTLGQTDLHVTGAAPNQNNQLSYADYQLLGGTSYANTAYSSISTGTYTDFALNSSGRSNVNMSGITRYGSRLDWTSTTALPEPGRH